MPIICDVHSSRIQGKCLDQIGGGGHVQAVTIGQLKNFGGNEKFIYSVLPEWAINHFKAENWWTEILHYFLHFNRCE